MTKPFVVHAADIPSQITVNLSMIEREMLAEMLTNMMIPAELATSNFQNILRKGLKELYKKRKS